MTFQKIDKAKTRGISRRAFLSASAATGGGLIISATMPFGGRAALAATNATVTIYVSIASDETVTIIAPASEMGQGVQSGLPQVVAEELQVDWTKVVVQQAPASGAYANPATGAQLVAGSSSMRGYFRPLLQAGAAAREMLVQAAATKLGTTASNCTVANGIVTIKGTSTSITYGAVAADAALLPVPTDPTVLSNTNGFHLVGTPAVRKDLASKVNGSAKFGIDVRVDGMVYAAIKHCPTLGGTLASTPATPAGALAVVPLGNAVAVVAKDTWTAFRLANSLSVSWKKPANAASNTSSTILSTAKTLLTTGTPLVAETVGNNDIAQAGAKTILDMTYTLPYLAHACMEPLNCTASVTASSCEIWAPTQAPGMCVATAAAITKLDPSKIKVNTMFMGGGLGRKFEQDYIAQAVTISKAIGKPVKLTWRREEDFGHDQYRPMAVTRIVAGLDATGGIASWYNRNVSPSILGQRGWLPPNMADSQATEGATELPYMMGARKMEWVPHPATIPVGFWRSVGSSINAFAVESAIDELAFAAKVDPLAFRQRLMANNPRALAVLNAAAALGNWSTPPGLNRARGIAFAESFGTLVAEVVELQLIPATATTVATVKMISVAAAVDCGFAVNPDTVKAQIEGGIVHGLNAAMWGKVEFSSGVSKVRNFGSGYPMMRMRDAPRIKVTIISNPQADPSGVGEPGVPPSAPALANAYFALTGNRLRTLPLQLMKATSGDD